MSYIKFGTIFVASNDFLSRGIRYFDNKTLYSHCATIYNDEIYSMGPDGMTIHTIKEYLEKYPKVLILSLPLNQEDKIKEYLQRQIDGKTKYDYFALVAIFLKNNFGTAPNLNDIHRLYCAEAVINVCIINGLELISDEKRYGVSSVLNHNNRHGAFVFKV